MAPILHVTESVTISVLSSRERQSFLHSTSVSWDCLCNNQGDQGYTSNIGTEISMEQQQLLQRRTPGWRDPVCCDQQESTLHREQHQVFSCCRYTRCLQSLSCRNRRRGSRVTRQQKVQREQFVGFRRYVAVLGDKVTTNHTLLSHLFVHGTSVADGIAIVEDTSRECRDVSYLMANATLLLNNASSESDFVSTGSLACSNHVKK